MSEPLDNHIIQQIDDYLANRMTPTQREQFELQLASDSGLQHELQFRQELYSMMGSKDWPLADSEVNSEAVKAYRDDINSGSLKDASSQIKLAAASYLEKKSRPKLGVQPWAALALVAASVALIFILTQNNSFADYYNDYHSWDELPSMVEKGSQNMLVRGELLFNEGNYQGALDHYEAAYVAGDVWHPNALLYTAAAYQELGQFDNAHVAYDRLIESDALESSRGLWFKAMLYLKQGDQSNCLRILKLITADPSNYNYLKANELRSELID
ncbi:MAG: hypothetical protein ABJM06_06085 [Gilvibacter sp.]